jgi:Tol biopolymer transport system component
MLRIHAWDCEVLLEALEAARSQRHCKTRAQLAHDASAARVLISADGKHFTLESSSGPGRVSVEVVTLILDENNQDTTNREHCGTAAIDAILVTIVFEQQRFLFCTGTIP